MDASGKDGVAKTVFKYCPPLVVDAHPFKNPAKRNLPTIFFGESIKSFQPKDR